MHRCRPFARRASTRLSSAAGASTLPTAPPALPPPPPMSRNTPSSGADRIARIGLAVALAALSCGAMAQTPPAPQLPAAVAKIAPGLTVRGGGEFTFYGISVYDGWYWSTPRGLASDAPF